MPRKERDRNHLPLLMASRDKILTEYLPLYGRRYVCPRPRMLSNASASSCFPYQLELPDLQCKSLLTLGTNAANIGDVFNLRVCSPEFSGLLFCSTSGLINLPSRSLELGTIQLGRVVSGVGEAYGEGFSLSLTCALGFGGDRKTGERQEGGFASLFSLFFFARTQSSPEPRSLDSIGWYDRNIPAELFRADFGN